MIYNFDTDNKDYALCALLVYAIYRSRDKSKFKVTPEMWGQIQRFVQASAKRAKTIPQFINNLQPKMMCPAINPKWVEIGVKGRLFNQGGTLVDIPNNERREFLTEVLSNVDDKKIIKTLLKETQFIILLVRDRLETEKPLEASFIEIDDGETL